VMPVVLFGSHGLGTKDDRQEVYSVERPVAKWRTFSDKEYGGASTSSFELSNGVMTFLGTLDFDRRDSEEFNERSKSIKGGPNGGDASLSSRTSTSSEEDRLPVAVRGYCAIKGYFSTPVDLRDYQGFELEVKSSTCQRFIFNTSFESLFDGDLYQVAVDLPANQWCTLHVPFSVFRLTSGGYDRKEQRQSDSLQLETLGFLISSTAAATPTESSVQPATSFSLQIRRILALPHLDDKRLKKQEIL